MLPTPGSSLFLPSPRTLALVIGWRKGEAGAPPKAESIYTGHDFNEGKRAYLAAGEEFAEVRFFRDPHHHERRVPVAGQVDVRMHLEAQFKQVQARALADFPTVPCDHFVAPPPPPTLHELFAKTPAEQQAAEEAKSVMQLLSENATLRAELRARAAAALPPVPTPAEAEADDSEPEVDDEFDDLPPAFGAAAQLPQAEKAYTLKNRKK